MVMQMSKKYFWLKLQEKFFNSKEIKLLRKIAGGDTFVIIYLKMLLLSAPNNGLIFFEEICESVEEELSLELDEDPENVKMTLAYLFARNLIEKVDGNVEMLTLPEMVGSETDAAERKRRSRKRAALCDIVTSESQSVTQSKSKSLELDRELEKRLGHEKSVTDAGEQRFEKFWEAYPKKVAKKAVLQKWKNLKVNDALFESIMKGLESWKQSQQWMKNGGQYIPNPTTFLNQERWNDEVTSFGDPRNRIPTDEEYKQVTAEEFYGI